MRSTVSTAAPTSSVSMPSAARISRRSALTDGSRSGRTTAVTGASNSDPQQRPAELDVPEVAGDEQQAACPSARAPVERRSRAT